MLFGICSMLLLLACLGAKPLANNQRTVTAMQEIGFAE